MQYVIVFTWCLHIKIKNTPQKRLLPNPLFKVETFKNGSNFLWCKRRKHFCGWKRQISSASSHVICNRQDGSLHSDPAHSHCKFHSYLSDKYAFLFFTELSYSRARMMYLDFTNWNCVTVKSSFVDFVVTPKNFLFSTRSGLGKHVSNVLAAAPSSSAYVYTCNVSSHTIVTCSCIGIVSAHTLFLNKNDVCRHP